jgi:signal transduction histidine kinase
MGSEPEHVARPLDLLLPAALARIAACAGFALVWSTGERSWSDAGTIVAAVITGAAMLAGIARPEPSTGRPGLLRAGAELAAVTLAAGVSGAWASPARAALVAPAVTVAAAGGIVVAAELSVVAAAVLTAIDLRERDAAPALRTGALWLGLMIVVAATAAAARRAERRAARQQVVVAERVGRLTEANTMLYSVQQVAQTIPASLDVEEVLDSTAERIRTLIDHNMLTILVDDEGTGALRPARAAGYRAAGELHVDALPAPLAEAVGAPRTVRRDMLGDGEAVATGAHSGLYVALRARDRIVGAIAIEADHVHGFDGHEAEILHGLAEPFGIALDNAQVFRRLRAVAADEERNRIARDLHDQVGSSLAFLGFEIDRLAASAARGTLGQPELHELRAEVSKMLGHVRETLYDLRTSVTDANDLASTLEQFASRVGARAGIEVDVHCRQTRRLPLVHERELWQIAREALVNVERHAQATRVQIRLDIDEDGTTLTVADDGKGLAPDGGRADSYGMRGMRERAAVVGGRLDVASSVGGTTVTVVLPRTAPPDGGTPR